MNQSQRPLVRTTGLSSADFVRLWICKVRRIRTSPLSATACYSQNFNCSTPPSGCVRRVTLYLSSIMSSVAKKRRRHQTGLTFYDDDDDTTAKRRTTDTQHLHTSFTATANGVSTRTYHVSTADPTLTQPRATTGSSESRHPSTWNTNSETVEHRTILGAESDGDDDSDTELFDIIPDSVTDFSDFVEGRKSRKRTASVCLLFSCVVIFNVSSLGLPAYRMGKGFCGRMAGGVTSSRGTRQIHRVQLCWLPRCQNAISVR